MGIQYHFKFFCQRFRRTVIRDMLHHKINDFLFLDTESFNDFLGCKWSNFTLENRLSLFSVFEM